MFGLRLETASADPRVQPGALADVPQEVQRGSQRRAFFAAILPSKNFYSGQTSSRVLCWYFLYPPLKLTFIFF